jgi:hypothetical protein
MNSIQWWPHFCVFFRTQLHFVLLLSYASELHVIECLSHLFLMDWDAAREVTF